MRRLAPAVAAGIVFVVAVVRPAAAQERPAFRLDGTVGWVGFADDGVVSETMAGAGARWYVGRRISLGPELVFIDGNNHHHLVVTANLTFDVRGPSADGRERLTPFVVAGGGVFRTTESFPDGEYSSTEGAFSAGGGLRAPIGDRVSIGVDARIGWELHVRVNALASVRLGR